MPFTTRRDLSFRAFQTLKFVHLCSLMFTYVHFLSFRDRLANKIDLALSDGAPGGAHRVAGVVTPELGSRHDRPPNPAPEPRLRLRELGLRDDGLEFVVVERVISAEPQLSSRKYVERCEMHRFRILNFWK